MHFKSVITLASIFFIHTLYAASTPRGPSHDALLGTWSTVNYFGQLVNPATGAVTHSLHSGRWFTFNADGTYEYMRIGSGQLISGVVVQQGTFEINGNTLNFHRKTDSWYPSRSDPSGRPMYKDRSSVQKSTVEVEFKGRSEIIVREQDGTVSTFRSDTKGNR